MAVERITYDGVMAARIDRLPAEAKAILNAAAVIGSQFDVDTVQALRPEAEYAQLAELVAATSGTGPDFRSVRRGESSPNSAPKNPTSRADH